MRQSLDMLAKTVRIVFLNRFHDTSMKHAAALLEQARIRDLVCERVLECVLDLRKETCLIQKLRCLKPSEALTDFFLRLIRDCFKKVKPNILANNGCRLKKMFFIW